VWNAIEGNMVICELQVSRQTLLVQELRRCAAFDSLEDKEPRFQPSVDLSRFRVRATAFARRL
jgi:hypothetical protein